MGKTRIVYVSLVGSPSQRIARQVYSALGLGTLSTRLRADRQSQLANAPPKPESPLSPYIFVTCVSHVQARQLPSHCQDTIRILSKEERAIKILNPRHGSQRY